MSIRTFALGFVGALALVATAHAHAPEVGKNGGQQTDGGNYHVEVVARGNTLDVFITDHAEDAVSTKGFKGTAILVVNGKAQRITLSPRGKNILTGTSPVELSTPIRGAIQITNTDNDTVQAKF